MKNHKIGVQLHPMREEFAKDPAAVFRRLKEMGYEGAEITMAAIKSGTDVLTAYGAPYFKKAKTLYDTVSDMLKTYHK